MSEPVDELFGDAHAPTPRRGLVLVLLGTGLLLSVFGLACTSVPGGLIVLAAWGVVDKESERVASGYLPEAAGTEVRRLRQAVLLGLGFVLVLFLVQAWLLGVGFYEQVWGLVVAVLTGMMGTPGA